MSFATPTFVFLFLPVLLVAYLLVPQRLKNYLLIGASAIFYAWDGGSFIATLILLIGLLYLLSRAIADARQGGRVRSARLYLAIGISATLSLLIFYKYAAFLVFSIPLAWLHESWNLSMIILPLGISFFTFQGISYLVDTYRGHITPPRKASHFFLYMILFPQLIAGPIIRYKDIQEEIANRRPGLQHIADGALIFSIGLAKKVLLADTLGNTSDAVFNLQSPEMPTLLAWLGITTFALQIYFDFSGYSDMAVGMARMFGFHFPQNFNYPYTARSVRDFWRRWHITLTAWFRDYVYIPLGGNRRGLLATVRNVMVVFFLVGAWHGASWLFVLWGLWHGLFVALEHVASRIGVRLRQPLGCIYTLLVVMVGWVFFRAENTDQAWSFFESMFTAQGRLTEVLDLELYVNGEIGIALLLGMVASTPVGLRVASWINARMLAHPHGSVFRMVSIGFVCTTLLFLSAVVLASQTHMPFIYYRF